MMQNMADGEPGRNGESVPSRAAAALDNVTGSVTHQHQKMAGKTARAKACRRRDVMNTVVQVRICTHTHKSS